MTKQDTKGYIPSKTADLSKLPKIEGFDFNKPFTFEAFLDAYATTGSQASKVASAIAIAKAMQREKATIFLSYTANMVSTGVRESIRFLVQHKKVHALITSAGGIEEDFIKCITPFALGEFNANAKHLHENGINRIGNIFVTNEAYCHFEKHMHKILDTCYAIQKEEGKPITTATLTREMGKYIENFEQKETSILYWAYKHDIPIITPAPTDGSLGDMIFFHRNKAKDFFLDVSQDMNTIITRALNAERTGVIALGGGSAKHYTLNAQIFREGCDFAIYINTHTGEDASDSGADTSEAVTWSKIKPESPQVKVTADATIIFPLIVAGAFLNKEP